MGKYQHVMLYSPNAFGFLDLVSEGKTAEKWCTGEELGKLGKSWWTYIEAHTGLHLAVCPFSK